VKIHVAGPWITDHEVAVVLDALRNGWYEDAYRYVETFEAEFARYHGRRFGVMTSNCTSALHVLLRALHIGEGDEVIVPDCTWIGSAAPIS
jgi:perosamine synthetase